jgi:hypothetical protein
MKKYVDSSYLADFITCTSAFAHNVKEQRTKDKFFNKKYKEIRNQFSVEQVKTVTRLVDLFVQTNDPEVEKTLHKINEHVFTVYAEIMYREDRLNTLTDKLNLVLR